MTTLGLSAHREGMEARHAARGGEAGLRRPGDRRRASGPAWCTRRAARYERFVRAIDTLLRRASTSAWATQWKLIDVPRDADVTTANGWLLVQLRSDWKPAADDLQGGLAHRDGPRQVPRRLRATSRWSSSRRPRVSLQDFTVTKDALAPRRARQREGPRDRGAAASGGKWQLREVRRARGGVHRRHRRRPRRERRLLDDRHQLPRAHHALPRQARAPMRARSSSRCRRSSTRKGLKVMQHEATSKDGTQDPVLPRDARGREARRPQPDDPLRLRRLRDRDDAELQRHHRLRVAREGRRLGARQPARRRRVRPRVAPHRAARGPRRRRTTTSSRSPRTSSRARSPRRGTSASWAAARAGCSWARRSRSVPSSSAPWSARCRCST